MKANRSLVDNMWYIGQTTWDIRRRQNETKRRPAAWIEIDKNRHYLNEILWLGNVEKYISCHVLRLVFLINKANGACKHLWHSPPVWRSQNGDVCPQSTFCLENRHILPISVKSLSYRCLRKNTSKISIVKKHYSAVYHSKVAHLRCVTHRFSHQKQPF